MKISIIGSGSWGVALANLLSNNGHSITIWSAIAEEVIMLNQYREHIDKLPGIKLKDDIVVTANLQDTIQGKEIIILAVPSSYVRSTTKLISTYIDINQIIVNVAKGLEQSTLMTLKDVINDVIPNIRVAVLSGPSHAEEVSRQIPTSVLVASEDESIVNLIQDIFMNETFRVYGNNDVLGVEIGGAIKNVIALAAGIADGLGYGDNTKAALMTRGLAEITRLGVAMGANINTFYGLSGIGDLIVTCTSMNSRNRRAGILIGQGATMNEALDKVKMVVEGVYAASAGVALAKKYSVDMPITETVYNVLFNNENCKEAVVKLMTRDKKFED